MAQELIMLDRDGVINELRHQYVKSVDDFKFLYQSENALKVLLEKEKRIAICSNQRGVSLGMVSLETLREIELRITKNLAENKSKLRFLYCTHLIDENCDCRKPKPGLLASAMKEFNAEKKNCIFVGDNISDYHAAQNAGVSFALVMTGHGKRSENQIPADVPRYKNLFEFALKQKGKKNR